MTAPPPPPVSSPLLAQQANGPDLLRVLLLGLNAWVVVLVVPALHAGVRGTGLLVVGAPLGVLGIGLALLRRRPHLAAWTLLAALPLAVALAIALRPELRALEAYPPFVVLLGALSLAVFGAAAATVVSRPPRTRPSTHQPLPASAPELSARTWLRRSLLAAWTLGSLAMLVSAPRGERRELEQFWGDAAPEAALLGTVVAAALGTGLLAVVVGPALRAERVWAPSARSTWARVTILLVVVALGAVAYAVYARANAR